MAGLDGLAMGADRRVAFDPAELVDHVVRQREVDFPGRSAGLLRVEPDPLEEALGDPVMAVILGEAIPTSLRQPCLASMPLDKP